MDAKNPTRYITESTEGVEAVANRIADTLGLANPPEVSTWGSTITLTYAQASRLLALAEKGAKAV